MVLAPPGGKEKGKMPPTWQRAVGPIDTCIWCHRHLSNNLPEGEGETFLLIDSIKYV